MVSEHAATVRFAQRQPHQRQPGTAVSHVYLTFSAETWFSPPCLRLYLWPLDDSKAAYKAWGPAAASQWAPHFRCRQHSVWGGPRKGVAGHAPADNRCLPHTHDGSRLLPVAVTLGMTTSHTNPRILIFIYNGRWQISPCNFDGTRLHPVAVALGMTTSYQTPDTSFRHMLFAS